MQVSKLRIMLDMYSEVELRLIIYRCLSHKPRPPLVTPRFKSINDAEQWLVENGYNSQYYTVFGKNRFDYLAGCRIYYSYDEKNILKSTLI